LTSVPISSHTGYEQQAKVWTYAGYWWAVMATANGTKIFRLDGTNWTDILTIAASTNSKADCKVVENVTHILLFRGASSNSYLVSVEYDASTNTYKLWSKRSSKITIVFESNTQTATMDMDGTGGMWVASDALNDINVRWSDYPYSTWSAPIAIASGVTDDDQSAIVALKNAGKIGVLWSNQNTKRWGFKTHTDGTAPATWSADEVPASQSALDLNHGFADDHMNIVPASDGTLYCAIKTGYDTPGYPKIALLVRRPSGTWDDVYPVTTYPVGTRPIIMLNEAKNKLKIIYSSQEGGGDILYKEALLSDLTTFSQEFTLFTGNYNFLTNTHQTYDPKIAVLITDQNSTSIKAAGFLGSDDPSSSITMTSPAAIRVPSEDVPVDPIDDLQANLIAYPNPFSTNAIITFTLPYADAYTVALYNINGVKVSVLKQGRAEAGKLNIVNIDGSRLSNGLYFVKVQAGAKSKTLKLALQK